MMTLIHALPHDHLLALGVGCMVAGYLLAVYAFFRTGR